MREFFDKLPRPLADAVKAARRRYGSDDFARGFAAGLHLARRAQGWNMARLQYKNDDRVTVRFHLPDKDYAEVQRLKSFFGRAALAAWRHDYNTVRPHSAIGNQPPAIYAKLGAPSRCATGPDGLKCGLLPES